MDQNCATNMVSSLFALITPNAAGQTLMVAGFILVLVSVLVAAQIARGGEFSGPTRRVFFACLAVGTFFIVAGPLAVMLPLSSGVIPRVPPEKSFARLGENSRVSWLIRLIPYDPRASPQMSLSNLTKLGPPQQKFTFVANYHELRGYTVEEAVRMTGGSYRAGQRVLAVIFRVNDELVPANAKGLLQTVQMLQAELGNGLANRLPLDKRDLEAIALYQGAGLLRWSWQGYGKDYSMLCRRATEFRCGSFDEKGYLGAIAEDWNPLGFASREPNKQAPCGEDKEKVCGIRDWEDATERYLPQFGARVFLIRNHTITELMERYVIDFEHPSQVVPDIGAAEPQ